MTLTQGLAIWVIVAVCVSPFIGEWLHRRRVNRDLRGQLDRSNACARQEKLLQLADEWDAATTDKERSAIYRKAEKLGLCDPPSAVLSTSETEYSAFMDSDEGPRAA